METNRFQYLVVLAREGTFKHASQRLHISQPALTQQIQKLEEDLGCTLIDRRTRPIEVTPVGKEVLRRAVNILEEVDALKRHLQSMNLGESGSVRMGIAPSGLYGPLPGVVRQYCSEHPQVNVTVEPHDTTALVAMVRESRLDAAVLLSAFAGEGLASHLLYSEPMVVAFPKGHQASRRPSVPLGMLKDEVFFMTSRSNASSNHDQVVAACMRAGFSPHVSPQAVAYDDQLGLVASGMGIAIVPRILCSLHVDDVTFRPLRGVTLHTDTTLVWREDNPNSANRSLVRFLRSLRSWN